MVIELRVRSPRTKPDPSGRPRIIPTKIFVLIMVQCVRLISLQSSRQGLNRDYGVARGQDRIAVLYRLPTSFSMRLRSVPSVKVRVHDRGHPFSPEAHSACSRTTESESFRTSTSADISPWSPTFPSTTAALRASPRRFACLRADLPNFSPLHRRQHGWRTERSGA